MNMNQQTFWQLIERTRGPQQLSLLEHHLRHASREERKDFDRILHAFHVGSYLIPLWDAVIAIMGFCSDDSFVYFRCWLIAQGEGVFCEVTQCPGRLCEFFCCDDWQLEDLLYVAEQAHHEETGACLWGENETILDYRLQGYNWLKKRT
jgi:hypothetical protein